MNGTARLPRLLWLIMALSVAGGLAAAVASFVTGAGVATAHKEDVDRNFAGIECTIQLLRLEPTARAALTDAEVHRLCPILTDAEAHERATTTTTAPPPGAQGRSSARSPTTRPTTAPPGRSPSTTGRQPAPPTSGAPAPARPAPTTTAPPSTSPPTTACLLPRSGICTLPGPLP